ncbi:MAG TPA: serine protein kinase RIO [Candidatus Woesearchaeota archaeon]|nr:serine protein kinase RIO [Candidatus Woesearchaeota archaeon]
MIREKYTKEKEKFKTYKEVFDEPTMRTIHKLTNEGHIEYVMGPISTGKEANVFLAKNSDDEFIAVKIFRTETSSFENMLKYIKGDRRFENIKPRKKDIVFTWCKKEFKNLEKAYNAGVDAPRPIISRDNILLLEFIGEGEIPAPTAKKNPPKDPKKWLTKILNMIKALYQKESLIHGDLSEYNILNFAEKPILIDIGQGVLKDHPAALELLKKDIENILNWFKRLGLKDIPEANKVYKEITGKKEDG